MITLFWILFWAALAMLVVAAGVSLHVRKKEALASIVPIVDDAAIERILRTGSLTVSDDSSLGIELLMEHGEPTPQEEIDDEEERFWSETWDEPTEW